MPLRDVVEGATALLQLEDAAAARVALDAIAAATAAFASQAWRDEALALLAAADWRAQLVGAVAFVMQDGQTLDRAPAGTGRESPADAAGTARESPAHSPGTARESPADSPGTARESPAHSPGTARESPAHSPAAARESPAEIAALWRIVDSASWVAPQLVACAFLVDADFVAHAEERLLGVARRPPKSIGALVRAYHRLPAPRLPVVAQLARHDRTLATEEARVGIRGVDAWLDRLPALAATASPRWQRQPR